MVNPEAVVPAVRRRRWPKVLAAVVAAVIAAPVVVFVLWAASNRLFDASARPLPQALQMPAASPVEGNGAYTLMGVLAPAGQDAAKAGAERWAADVAWGLAVAAGQAASAPEAAPGSFKQPTQAPWSCDVNAADCYDIWLKQAEALATQRQALAPVGARCETLVANLGRYEEPLPPRLHVLMPLPQMLGGMVCANWFHSGAALAFVAGDLERVPALLQASDRLARALMAGGHSLVQQMVAARMVREQMRLAGTLLLREPRLAAALAPLTTRDTDEGGRIRRWMVYEAGYQRTVVDTPSELCNKDAWICLRAYGVQRERTRQAMEDLWLAELKRTEAPEPALGLLAAGRSKTPAPLETGLRWFNPVGQQLVADVMPSYNLYHARVADQNLHRLAIGLAAALQQADVPAAERAAWSQTWLERHAAEPYRARFGWSDEGRVLGARTWEAEESGASGKQARNLIRLRWPA